MSRLNLNPNIDRPDDFYEDLLGVHEGLTKAESDALNARLILILANQIGDREVLAAALAAASGQDMPAEASRRPRRRWR